MSLWKVARVDESKLDPDQRSELLGWIRYLGVEPSTIRPVFAVSEDETHTFRLHLSRFVYDEAGNPILDHAANELQTEPFVLTITGYPQWLPAISQQQGVS